MNRKTWNKLQSGLSILLGVLLLTGALALTLYNDWDARRADESAQSVAKELGALIAAGMAQEPEAEEPEEPETLPFEVPHHDVYRQMPTSTIKGNEYIGILEIPSKKLSLPVMSVWDYDKLNISPCLYSGSYYTGDMVIAGHNYPKHFNPLHTIEPGAEILFTSVKGVVMRYEVTTVETLMRTDVDKMVMSSYDWDLTLFTCTTGGGSRCTVRCIRVD